MNQIEQLDILTELEVILSKKKDEYLIYFLKCTKTLYQPQ